MTGADLNRFAQLEEQLRIARTSTTIDYAALEQQGSGFDYDGLLAQSSIGFGELHALQAQRKVGNTPLHELSRLTAMVRSISPTGQGAIILLKDEAANASGSFKARRAVLPAHVAAERGFPGIIAATSGNYGAAVAAQAAMVGLPCIVIQEAFDARGKAQPEVLEKARACEALGAEVVQLSVGPELFLVLNQLLDDTGYFSGSLFTPFAVHGIETLGAEIATQTRSAYGRFPDTVVVSQGGGGNLQGTARGLNRLGARPTMVGAAVRIDGLSMASDHDFNRKSFTTSHTGFAVPYLRDPDRIELPRNAARPLRYIDRMVTVEQGEVFYTTELLSQIEGLERGPAGNTALAAAIAIAGDLPEDHIVVVQESEYTGAGKSHHAQLDHARRIGINVTVGSPSDSVPGVSIVLPEDPKRIACADLDMHSIRREFIRRKVSNTAPSEAEIAFLAAETQLDTDEVAEVVLQ